MKKIIIILLLILISNISKGQINYSLIEYYPFLTLEYIQSNQIKEIKIYNSDSLLVDLERYNQIGYVVENYRFENTIILEKNEFYYITSNLPKNIRATYKSSDFYSTYNYEFNYELDEKLRYIIRKKIEGLKSSEADTLYRIYYDDNGRKSHEIKYNQLIKNFIYENNSLVKQLETSTDSAYQHILNFSNIYYDNNNRLTKKKNIDISIARNSHKEYEILYIYKDKDLVGFKDEYVISEYFYENGIVSKIKINDKYFDVDYVFYE